MPDALVSRITSLGPGVGSGNSLSSSLRSPRNTTPFMAPSGALSYPLTTLRGGSAMTVYELRTYTLHVGKMGEAVKLYTEFGYPALQKGGQDKKLIGDFQADTVM